MKKLLLIPILLVLFISGCSSKELDLAKADLSNSKTEIESLKKKANENESKNKKLTEENKTLSDETVTLNKQLELYRGKTDAQTVSTGVNDPVEKEYAENFVDILNLKAEWHEDILYGNKVAGYTFNLKNNGNKDIEYLTVTLYFKDKEGNSIAEESLSPINNFSYDDKILKANYSWKMDSGIYYQAKDVSKEWKEGSVDIKITELRFKQEE